MTEALGRSQVFEYLIDLSKNNKIYLISFEKSCNHEKLNQIEKLSELNNIEWKYFQYSNKYGIFSTLIQIIISVIYSAQLVMKNNIDIVHSRSMIPGTMAVILRKFFNIKHIFDIRGFVFDEKVDNGRLNEFGALFKMLKKLEKILYKNSDHIVTLTEVSKNIISEQYKISPHRISVIPTCASQDVFTLINEKEKFKIKCELGFSEKDLILIHTGSVSNSYDFDLEVSLFRYLHEQDVRIKFLVVNKGEHEYIKTVFKRYDIDENMYKVISSDFENVHKYLNISIASIFFIPPTHSKKASSPTKFAENLLCHLPSITNIGVGDMQILMNKYNVGYILDMDDLKLNMESLGTNVYNFIKKEQSYEFLELYNEKFNKANASKQYGIIYDLILKKF